MVAGDTEKTPQPINAGKPHLKSRLSAETMAWRKTKRKAGW